MNKNLAAYRIMYVKTIVCCGCDIQEDWIVIEMDGKETTIIELKVFHRRWM